jgi:protein translocase SEC61 complex gamma subunit
MFEGIKRLRKVARRPDRKEFMLMMKINLIGLVAIGAITFIIRMIAMVLLGR